VLICFVLQYANLCKDKLIEKGIVRYPAIRTDFPGDFKALLTIKYENRNILKNKLDKTFDVKEA